MNSAIVSRFYVQFIFFRKRLISRFVEDVNTTQRLSFSFPELR